MKLKASGRNGGHTKMSLSLSSDGEDIIVETGSDFVRAKQVEVNGKIITPEDVNGERTVEGSTVEEFPGMRVKIG